MGQEAPLNLTIFQSKADYDICDAYFPPEGLPTLECIHRKVYSGYSAYGAIPVDVNDPAGIRKF